MNSPLFSSLVFGLGLLFVLSMSTALGWFENANLAMVDRLFDTVPNRQATPPVLLVSTTESQRNNPALIRNLVSTLQAYRPRFIYVMGHSAQSDDLAALGAQDVSLVDSTSHLQELLASNAPLPDPDSGDFVTQVMIKAGHYRQWQIVENIQANSYAGFQARLAGIDRRGTGIIDFTMEDGLIPLVTARRVLDQGLAPALIEDRIVLVGDALEAGLGGGYTVPNRRGTGISQLELQAYVLHSALSDRILSFSGAIGTVIGVLLLGAVSTLLFQWLPAQVSALLTIVICLGVVALQWIAVKFGALILPAWELILAQIANLVALHQLQRSREEQTLSRIIAKTNSRLSERVQPINFNRSDDPWKKILSLVNQQLNIHRSIFLEKVPADHRVREIEALNCSIDDISERRRDYEREPYSVALEVNGPSQPFRDYFKEVAENELQYMVPLSFGGEVLGFWALSLIPARNWNQGAFENNVRSFSLQIAELLYHRQHWSARQKKIANPLRQLLSVEVGLRLHHRLNNIIDLMEHRLDILEDVLNGLSTAVVVYDVFGQVLHTNSIIEHLARENDVAVYQLTAMELLAESNGIPLDEARNKLRYVTLKHQTLIQNSSLFSNHGSYLLYIRPLLVEQDSNMDQVQPFQIRGILFEFADLTQVQRHDEIRQDIADQFFAQLRTSLSSIGYAAENLASAGLDSEGRPRSSPAAITEWLSGISDGVAQTSQLTDRVEEELRNQIHMREQTVPTNVLPILSRTIAAAEESAQAKELRIAYQQPGFNTLNFVEPNTFEQLLDALLDLLIDDAAHGSTITIDVTRQDKADIHIRMTSNGNGMPEEQLQQTLAIYQSYLDINEDPITRVSVLSHQVLRWDGEVVCHSDIAAGFDIDIRLKTFNLSLSRG